MDKPLITKETHNPGTPNQKALNEFLDRYYYFMAKRDMELRAKKAKGRNRAASIKI